MDWVRSRTRFPSADLKKVESSDHPALTVSKRLTAVLVEARDKGLISDITLATLDQNVQLLVDYLGGCERINSTPLPFAYMVHLRRVMIVYCCTLPFALVDPFGWLTVPAVLGVAYTFFGIEEIGVEIENPFGHDLNDLALEELCSKISKNVWCSVATVSRPKPMSSRPARSSRSGSSNRDGNPVKNDSLAYL